MQDTQDGACDCGEVGWSSKLELEIGVRGQESEVGVQSWRAVGKVLVELRS